MANDVVDILNDLIETCKDGQYGFETAAKHVTAAELREIFQARAEDCERGADELRALVVQYGGKPDDGGSATGAVHRGWTALRGAVTNISDASMLEECERGEDAAVARYRKALANDALPDDARRVVERQAMGAQRNHDQIKSLRDRVKAAG